MTFSGKTVAITGADGGIGQALCRYFGAEGRARSRRSIAAPRSKVSRSGFAPEGVAAESAIVDIGDAEAVARPSRSCREARGDRHPDQQRRRLEPSELRQDRSAGWRDDINSNLNGAYNCAHAVLPGMIEERPGVIVNVGSVNGLAALGDPAYSAAKAGMIAMTRSLAQEYGRFGIRVNIVLPGTVRTPIWNDARRRIRTCSRPSSAGIRSARIVEPIDIAHAVGFLASDLAAAITGVALPVDCGLTAGNIVMARELTLEDF